VKAPAHDRRPAPPAGEADNRVTHPAADSAKDTAACTHFPRQAPPAPRHLASAVIVQLVLSQQPADGCPAGYTTLAAPFSD